MAVIDETIDVNVPLRTAYNQWTQFEDFPRFMEGVEEVHQLDATTLEWRAKVGGVEKTWRAKVLDQVPDNRVTWASISGARNDGMVSFSALDSGATRVNLRLDVEPESPLESAGVALGILGGRVRGDLERFRAFIESKGVETGAWRSAVTDGQPTPTAGARADR